MTVDIPLRKPFLMRVWEFVNRYRLQILALLFSVALIVLAFIFRAQILQLKGAGYTGVFVVNLVGNATVILPVPSLAIDIAGGTALNPFLVGLIAGAAAPIGELTAYLAGYSGSPLLENSRHYPRIKRWMHTRGFLTIFVIALIPNPLFHLAGMAAGALRFKVCKFLVSCWAGETIKATVFALFGSVIMTLVSHLFK